MSKRRKSRQPKGQKDISMPLMGHDAPRNALSRHKKAEPTKGGKKYKEGTVIDQINEYHAKDGKRLHPTKGFRELSVRQDAAGIVTANIRQGHISPIDTQGIRQQLGFHGHTTRKRGPNVKIERGNLVQQEQEPATQEQAG